MTFNLVKDTYYLLRLLINYFKSNTIVFIESVLFLNTRAEMIL